MFSSRIPDRTFDEMRGSCDEGRGLVCAFLSGAVDLYSDLWYHVKECQVCQMDIMMGQVQVDLYHESEPPKSTNPVSSFILIEEEQNQDAT